GNDTYFFSLGDGSDTVSENDATSGNTDKVLFASNLSKDNIALFMSGNNLQIGYLNSSDLITVEGQNTATGKIERFELSNGLFMIDTNINQVIADMSAYATANNISFTSLNDVKNNQGLMSIVAAGWHV
ncbi:MAG: hypothetical protein FD167_5838, partial [bacterium]